MKKLKQRQLVWCCAALMLAQFWSFSVANAAADADVVINEIAWAGSTANSNDEWIELYNGSTKKVDLSGWSLWDDGELVLEFEELEISAHGYVVIADRELVLGKGVADVLTGLSLANSGDSLELRDAAGHLVDSVEEWFGGDASAKASMERIDPAGDGSAAENWASAVDSNGLKDRDGEEILGTPGSVNSVFDGEAAEISLNPGLIEAELGDKIEIVVKAQDFEGVIAYGLDIVYDSEALKFTDAVEEEVFGDNSTFNSALENGKAGRIVVAGASLDANGVDGEFDLFKLKFEVLEEGETELKFGGRSFVNNGEFDLPIKFDSAKVLVGEDLPPVAGEVDPVTNLKAVEAEDRYALELSWKGEAETYVIMRENLDGSFQVLGSTDQLSFIDSKEILPGVEYRYRVVAQVGGGQSETIEVLASDERGVFGDISRDDRVDGRDILNLALAFGSELGEENFSNLADLTRDGGIDGSDLIEIGANFGLKYEG